MGNLTIENATVTATLNGLRYVHSFVTNITIADPRENALTVSPQSGSNGIAYRTGTTSAVTGEMTARGLEVPLADMYKKAFNDQERIDFMIVDSATGERYDMNNALVRTNPLNTTITEGESSLDVAINFACPPADYNHTSATS
jgi:hypothetical protein